MLLRESGAMEGRVFDPRAVTDASVASGVPFGEELVAFASASVTGSEAELAQHREALEAAMGVEAMVDAAGVAANFERMVRIADATGIPLDKPVAVFTVGLRQELGIDAFGAARNTPKVGALLAALGRLGQPLARRLMARDAGRS